MPQDGCDRKAHVPDGAIAPERHGVSLHIGRDRIHRILDVLGFRLAYDDRREVRMRAADGRNAGARRLLAFRLRNKKDDDTQDPSHLLERFQACLELGHGLSDRRCMVIGAHLADRAGPVICSPV